MAAPSEVINEAAMLALSAVQGDFCLRTDLSQTFRLTGTNPATLAHWTIIGLPRGTSIYTDSVTGKKIVARDGEGGGLFATETGPVGPTGPAGPNTITGATTTSLAGPLKGNGTNVLAGAIDLSGAEATGTLADARMLALTGDVTTSVGSKVTTIANDAVTYTKMQPVSTTDRLLGRATAGAGDVEEIPCTAAGRALLDDADAAAQRTTLGLSNVDNTSDASKPIGTATQTALDLKAPLASPTLTGTPAAPTAAGGTNTTQIATTAFVVNEIATAVAGLLDFKGGQDCSANPNYPAASKGDAYYVTVAGKIGGASGKSVDVGDVYVASADNAGGTEASVGTSWFVLEHNLQGALLSANNLSDVANPATARSNLGLGTLATQNGTFSGTSSGTNTGDQTITLTGGVTGSGTGSFAATVVTNANLTGPITSAGNATAVASQTGTGSKFVMDTSPTLVTPNIGAATGTSLAATGGLTSSGTAGLGYAAGAGGAVTQATNKSTGVTLNKICGQITMSAAALAAAAEVTFTVTNSTVAAGDVVNVNHGSAGTGGAYVVQAHTIAAGSFRIMVGNMSAGSLSEAIVINFAVVKAVNA